MRINKDNRRKILQSRFTALMNDDSYLVWIEEVSNIYFFLLHARKKDDDSVNAVVSIPKIYNTDEYHVDIKLKQLREIIRRKKTG